MEKIKKDLGAWERLTAANQATVEALIEEAKEWLGENKNASSKDFEKKIDKIERKFRPLEAKTVDIQP